MSIGTLLAAVFAWSIVALLNSQMCCGAISDQRVKQLFSMAERLENLHPWTIPAIEKITGRILEHRSYPKYESSEKPDDLLLSDVQVLLDRKGNITAVLLDLPHKGLGISHAVVTEKFGKCTNKTSKTILDEHALMRFGFRTMIGYEYKRKNGGWLTFEFDDDKTKQLRILEVY